MEGCPVKKITIGTVIVAIAALPISFAQDPEEILVKSLELDKLFNLGSGLLAGALFILTALAYRRQPKERLKFVSIAFMIFAIKGFLVSAELFFGEWPWVDPVSSFLDFAILLSFFYGVIKK